MQRAPTIESLTVHACRVPTDGTECDGTLCWSATEVVVVELKAAGVDGLGYSYTQAAPAAALIRDKLQTIVVGADAFDLGLIWQRMNAALRNLGRPGLGLMAIAAVDIALWDLKARLLGVPLAQLLGRHREAVPVYGSGGFTNYDDARLGTQLGGWVGDGLSAVKMKIGSAPDDDPRRVSLARQVIGDGVTLMVDANGAFDRVGALQMARRLADYDVRWFEEPVSSDDLDGLRWVCDRAPPGMAISAGEYGWDADYFRKMIGAGAVGVLQADATRCGYTGFLQAGVLCDAQHLKLSAHCAPAVHVPVCCAVPRLAHLEYFHDHTRLERMLFDGLPLLRDGALWPDLQAPGHGLRLRHEEVQRHGI
ncbi:enolase C-terminal domain-like protein [Solimonas marina]|uniref:enolase C-terminal domain-like protein n=1 Tax=Solimonas marina TaxID=2714601 RepID=UPI0019D2F4D3